MLPWPAIPSLVSGHGITSGATPGLRPTYTQVAPGVGHYGQGAVREGAEFAGPASRRHRCTCHMAWLAVPIGALIDTSAASCRVNSGSRVFIGGDNVVGVIEVGGIT